MQLDSAGVVACVAEQNSVVFYIVTLTSDLIVLLYKVIYVYFMFHEVIEQILHF